jgi:predicted Zn-dependent peptidase
MTIALTVLGSGLGSRLYQALRREASLAYTVAAGAVTARAGARAGLLVSCAPESVAGVEARLLREANRLAQEPVSTEEIQRAKEYTCTSYALNHQRNADLAHALGAFEVAADQGFELDRALPGLIREATPEDVRAAARSMFAATAAVRVTPS